MNATLLILIAAPLFGTLLLIFFGKTALGRSAPKIATLCVAVSFMAAVKLFLFVFEGGRLVLEPALWIHAGSVKASFGLNVDPLSALFLFFITLIGMLIHVYSVGYMHGDKGTPRYFAFLNFFVFCMIMLVLADNFLLLFFFWEGVGLASYLLIGFWFEKPSAAEASKKAFLVNRIGDACFLAAILFILTHFKTLRFEEVFLLAPVVSGSVITLVTLLLFAGATGKSAQIPLFTWLPDAMEGPTPVSALIHAATMVTAGVYMVVRCFPLFVLSSVTLTTVAWIGGLTAFFAATIALRQNDVKRVLAYSTISQLGYMFLAAGLLLPAAAIFHLVTHAFFKALLFLGAGSLMHALHNETDIRKMGRLRPHLKWTWMTFLVGSLALAGIPPLAGFFSKEEILKGAFAGGHYALGWIALAASFMTAFYIFRVYFKVFHGEDHCAGGSASSHESGPSMVIPLAVLSVFSILAGGWLHHAGHFSLAHLFEGTSVTDRIHQGHQSVGWVVWASIFAGLLGVCLAYLTSVRRAIDLSHVKLFSYMGRVLERKYWMDEVYDRFVTRPLARLARFSRTVIDEAGIDGGVRLVAESVSLGSMLIRRAHGGNVQRYLFIMLVAIVVVLVLFMAVDIA